MGPVRVRGWRRGPEEIEFRLRQIRVDTTTAWPPGGSKDLIGFGSEELPTLVSATNPTRFVETPTERADIAEQERIEEKGTGQRESWESISFSNS
jgi:hypothetical protein